MSRIAGIRTARVWCGSTATHSEPRRCTPRRQPFARRLATMLAAATALSLLPGDLSAQYFGRNKVQYRTFDFQVIRTENFDVYYYPEMREAAIDAARMVERSYARLSRILQHDFQERKPLIIYASHTDFQQTNAIPSALDESTGGVAESLKGRMILPFTGSYADFDHVLTHELVHGFQYDVIFRRGMMTDAAPFNMRLPLWFMEGMAEYLSIGRIDPLTISWLRDATLNGYLRSIGEMSMRDDYLSYRFGQSLWAYIGSKWGDEVIGILLQRAPRIGVERAFVTTLGLSMEELNREWQAAVRTTYLAQVTEFDQPDAVGEPLNRRQDLFDPWYLAPALSPDGRQMVYLSQRDGLSFDLWLADAQTARPLRRLVQSARDANFESLRYMNSGAAFSKDGRYLAFAAKAGGQDAVNVYDLRRNRIVKRLRFDMSGIQNPSWSPDGKRIVFTGLRGGLSNLYITDLDGRLTQLTDDRYSALLPEWSPDGSRIAFTTDREGTDLDQLTYGNKRIALIDPQTRQIEILPHQEEGKNINAVWSPDGRHLMWVSDRTGTNDLYLYELETRKLSRVTKLLAGAIAITPLSPVLSWSASGRMLFTYFERAGYSTFAIADPLSLPREDVSTPRPVIAEAADDNGARQAVGTSVSVPVSVAVHANVQSGDAAVRADSLLRAGTQQRAGAASRQANASHADAASRADATLRADTATSRADTTSRAATASAQDAASHADTRLQTDTMSRAGVAVGDTVAALDYSSVASFYRAQDGSIRASADAPQGGSASGPVSVRALLDDAALSLPDVADFEFREYRPKLTADMIGRPSVGASVGGAYWGNGMYGGSYLTMSDMLGNHNLLIAGSVNGALTDASIYTMYSQLQRRLNWGVGVWQAPIYSYLGGGYIPMEVRGEERIVAANVFRRDVVRGAQFAASYPFSTFRRIEFSATGVSYGSDILYRGIDAQTYEPVEIDQKIDGFRYMQPQAAMVFDNSVFGWTGPVMGRRYRAQLGRTFGDLQFNEALLDFRNYTNWKQRIVLAARLVGLTRFGGDAERFALYWGGPYYIRGYDYGSFNPNDRECTGSRNAETGQSVSRCPARDQLVGASAAFINTELRFPLITELQIGAVGAFPPVDAVAFFDGGVAWDGRVCRAFDYSRRGDICAAGESVPVRVAWRRQPGEDPYLVRAPLYSYGVGLRINIYYTVIRLDYAFPANRESGGVLSFGLGPSF